MIRKLPTFEEQQPCEFWPHPDDMPFCCAGINISVEGVTPDEGQTCSLNWSKTCLAAINTREQQACGIRWGEIICKHTTTEIVASRLEKPDHD